MDIKINTELGALDLNTVWLRDNCQCSKCVDKSTGQKVLDYVLTENIKVQNVIHSDNKLRITWTDGHDSEYSHRWIEQQLVSEKFPPLTLWYGDEIEKLIPTINYDQVINCESGLKNLIHSILEFGVGIVSKVEPSMKVSERLANIIGPIRNTLYGTFWTVDSAATEKIPDTAYGNVNIGQHTDNTYFHEPSGIQVFHYTIQAAKGGHLSLTDGFLAARILKEQNREAYDCLSSSLLEWNFVSEKDCHKVTEPIFKINPVTNDLQQIRYNMHDRSSKIPHTAGYGLKKFYDSLRSLNEIIKQPRMQWIRQFPPDSVIFVNNWRILHGRTAFTGKRKLCGCYLEMGTLLSKARLLKIIL